MTERNDSTGQYKVLQQYLDTFKEDTNVVSSENKYSGPEYSPLNNGSSFGPPALVPKMTSASPSRPMTLEAELKRAVLQKQHLELERQMMEQMYRERQQMLEAQMASAVAKLQESAAAIPSTSGQEYVMERSIAAISPSAPDGVEEYDGADKRKNFISSAPLLSPDMSPLQELSTLDSVSIRQLQSRPGSLDESYEVVTPGGDVILRANFTCALSDAMLMGMKRTVCLDVFDNQLREVINLRPGPDKSMEVFVCGELACVLRRMPTVLRWHLMVYDNIQRPLLKIKGPYSNQPSSMFNIQTLRKVNIGKIDKQPSENLPAGYEPRNHGVLQFPLELDARCKAALLAASFLIVQKSYCQVRKEKIQAAVAEALKNYVQN